MQVPQLEKELGMEVYSTKSPGIDGKIRQLIDDFIVEELLIDGSLAEVSPLIKEEKPYGEGRYLICVLVKRKWDTFLAVRMIAERLHISQKRVRFAGIKDTKALTAQHISLQNVAPDKVSDLQIKDIIVYPLHFSKNKIYSQLIKGNKFHITIRGIPHSPSVIEDRFKNIRKTIEQIGGVPNFFGHQRFGTIRPNTHKIGMYLTKEDPKKAAIEFLAEPSIHEHPEAREARQKLGEALNFEEAMQYFPRFLKYEHIMLRHLAKDPSDFVGAFRELPRRLRKLFVQAYQSYLFNRFLSERIRRGIPINVPQIGDYLLHMDEYGLPTEECHQATEMNIQLAIKFVKDGKMCLALPLVGPKQLPSSGTQGEIEREILNKENVALEDFKLKSLPEATAEGRLRPALNPVWNLVQEEISEDKEDPSSYLMKLGFTLNRGSYATVILREFMKPQDLIVAGY